MQLYNLVANTYATTTLLANVTVDYRHYEVKVERDRVIRRHSNPMIRRSSLSLPTPTDQATAASTSRKSIAINNDKQENIVNKSVKSTKSCIRQS